MCTAIERWIFYLVRSAPFFGIRAEEFLSEHPILILSFLSAKSTSSFYSCTDSHQGRDLAVMSREKCRTIDVAMIAPLLSFLYLIHFCRECPSDLLSSPLRSLSSVPGPSSKSPPQPSLCPTPTQRILNLNPLDRAQARLCFTPHSSFPPLLAPPPPPLAFTGPPFTPAQPTR